MSDRARPKKLSLVFMDRFWCLSTQNNRLEKLDRVTFLHFFDRRSSNVLFGLALSSKICALSEAFDDLRSQKWRKVTLSNFSRRLFWVLKHQNRSINTRVSFFNVSQRRKQQLWLVMLLYTLCPFQGHEYIFSKTFEVIGVTPSGV